MSTPRTLDLPPGVEAIAVDTERGSFATHVVRPEDPRGHVLLVPGWTGSKEDFTPLLPLLADAGLAATAYDQRGQLDTPAQDTDDFSLDGFAADAASLVADLGPSHLLGHSFGGLVAQHAAITHTASWRSLALLCTGPGALGVSPKRPLDQVVAALEGGVSALELAAALRGKAAGTAPPDVEEFLARRAEANSRASLTAITRLLLDAPDEVDQVAATGLPAWVGRGVDDDAWPHDRQADMAARLGVEVHLIADAEHSPAVENPAGLAAALLPFYA